jgi:hypothetical protein
MVVPVVVPEALIHILHLTKSVVSELPAKVMPVVPLKMAAGQRPVEAVPAALEAMVALQALEPVVLARPQT